MIRVQIFTLDQKKNAKVVWFNGTADKKYLEFIQYILDNISHPEDFYVGLESGERTFLLMDLAHHYGMRKRTFEERMNNAVICADFVKEMLL